MIHSVIKGNVCHGTNTMRSRMREVMRIKKAKVIALGQ
ncbi:Uncharacterised protein [Citrobacter werkmanii]|nr:Uncharacterised protein [Citrobacter werkmanii]CAC9276285.1 Uncharacterised protein [Citrobacter werkmanii]